jgi:hypothetical protein
MARLFPPSTQDKDRVRKLAASGASEQDIAALMSIPVKRLRTRFRSELQTGLAEGKQQVLDRLYEAASSGSNLSATIFWIKSVCGWRDTGAAQSAAAQWPAFVVQCA